MFWGVETSVHMRLQKARFFACFLVKRRLEGGKISCFQSICRTISCVVVSNFQSPSSGGFFVTLDRKLEIMIIGYTSAEVKESAAGCKEIKDYAAKRGFWLEIVYNGISIDELCRDILSPNDILIIRDINSLGSSLLTIRDIFHLLSVKKVKLYSAREDYVFLPEQKAWLDGFDAAVGLRTNIASRRTAEALSQCKARGIKLGMKKGARLKKKLDGQESQIRRLLDKGMAKTRIARELGVSVVTLYNFIKDKGLEVENAR